MQVLIEQSLPGYRMAWLSFRSRWKRRAHAAHALRLRTKKPGAIRPGRVLLDDPHSTQDSVTCVKRLSTLRGVAAGP
jgi:hypothetical protein